MLQAVLYRLEAIQLIKIAVLLGAVSAVLAGKISIQGTKFYVNGKETFLGGGSVAWINYAYDFGNNQFNNYPKREYAKVIQNTKNAGGNSLRVWVHIQGETSPQYDSRGIVIGTDKQGTFIDDFTALLDIAQENDVFIFPCLWNFAVDQDNKGHLDGLLKNEAKLWSYINKALIPWVNAVKDHPALGGWDIANAPGGMLIPGMQNSDPCFDTTALENSGAGWAGRRYTFKQVLKFINWQAAAIKAADPSALVTLGDWNPKPNVDLQGNTNHYTDECLRKAGGKHWGTLDFWQFHSYSWQGKFDSVSPFLHDAADYSPDRPIVIGEFWEQDGGGMTDTELFQYIYNHGYQGAWSWDIHSNPDQYTALQSITSLTSNGVIPVDI